MQRLFEVTVGGADSYWLPAAQTVRSLHTRSDVCVAATDAKVPVPLPSEAVAQTVSAAQSRSVAEVGGTDWYSVPAAQTVKAVHLRSDVRLGPTVSYSVSALHCRAAAHCRSDVAVGAATRNSDAAHSVSGAHSRSDVGVAGDDSCSVYG